MIFGVGTDICDVRRIRASYARRGERFAARVLGPHEIEVFRSRLARVASDHLPVVAELQLEPAAAAAPPPEPDAAAGRARNVLYDEA